MESRLEQVEASEIEFFNMARNDEMNPEQVVELITELIEAFDIGFDIGCGINDMQSLGACLWDTNDINNITILFKEGAPIRRATVIHEMAHALTNWNTYQDNSDAETVKAIVAESDPHGEAFLASYTAILSTVYSDRAGEAFSQILAKNGLI